MRITDSHCHLDSERFAEDLDLTLTRARAAGVDQFLAIGTGNGPPNLDVAIKLAEQQSGVWATVGVHPHDAAKASPDTFVNLEQLCEHPKVVALGEIGLDFHYDFAPRDVQVRVFLQQLEIARNRLPIVVHTREAWNDTFQVLRDHWHGNPGILHCFSGGVAEVQQAIHLGLHVSFGGVVTFANAKAVREAARLVPDDLLLIETDAPYLAPVPHRGKRNEPAFLPETLRKLAEIRGQDVEHLAQITTDNFDRLMSSDRGLLPSDAAGYTGTTQ